MNVVATDSPVNASRMNANVTPVSAEYRTKSSEAVPAAILSTRAERKNTMPSWAIMRPQ